MCDRNKEQCDEKRDHKDQHQDLGDLHKMLNKDDNKQGDFSGMKGDAHGGMRQDPACGGQKCGDKKGAECDKGKECH